MPLPAWSIAVTEWTPARVEERLRKAVALKARLSGEAPVGEARDEPPFDGGRLGFERNDEVVAHAADALSWLRWLDPDDARIVVARLEGARWKLICWRFDMSRPTADRRWRYALAVIAWRLNGHAKTDRTPSLRSLLGLRRAA